MIELAFAILLLMTPKGDAPAHFKRHAYGPEGRSLELSEFIQEASLRTGVDAFTLAALAYTETRFNSRVLGARREASIMQFMPLSPPGKTYWRGVAQGMKQTELDKLAMFLGAEHLARGIKKCGNQKRAVGWYKSGRCCSGPAVVRVFKIRRQLRRAGGLL